MTICMDRPYVARGIFVMGADEEGSHSGYVMFQLAEVAVPRRLFAEILRLIDGLRPTPAPTRTEA